MPLELQQSLVSKNPVASLYCHAVIAVVFFFNAVSFGASPWGKISLTPFLLHFP